MLALEITSMKNFMSHLLSGDTFDGFLLEEATINTSIGYTIDGHINADFFPPEERDREHIPYDFRPWSELKGLCFDLIKGKHTPLFFKFVLQLKPDGTYALLHKMSQGSAKEPISANSETDFCQPFQIQTKTAELPPLTGDLAQVKALVLNIRYDGAKAILTTGTSYYTFVMSREADLLWDNALCKYLDEKGIGYEKL